MVYILLKVFVLTLIVCIRIDMESLGKIVSNDFFNIENQYYHSSKISVYAIFCRSPPINTSFFEICIDWRFLLCQIKKTLFWENLLNIWIKH